MAAAAVPPRVTVVLGSQWGDEGKGKLVDVLAEFADLCCRCQVCAFIGFLGAPLEKALELIFYFAISAFLLFRYFYFLT